MKHFVGGGRFLPGIPARDLADDEYQALSAEDKRRVDSSGLYGDKPTKTPKEMKDAR